MVATLRVALEQHTIALPINSRNVLSGDLRSEVGEDGEELSKDKTNEELSVYIEADAAQVELGNMVAKRTQSGSYVYDVDVYKRQPIVPVFSSARHCRSISCTCVNR